MAIKGPAVIGELLHQGFALHQKGDLLGAGEFYAQILRQDPLHFDALHLSGLIAAKTEQFDIAAELIAKAISVNPNNAPAYCNIGNVYLNSKKNSLAIENYSKALGLNPRYEEAFYSRGLAYQRLGKLDSAKSDYETALKLNPKHIGTLTNLGNVLQLQKKYDEAIERYGQAIGLNQNFPEPFNNRGNLYHEQKRYKEALEDFSAALAINPNYPEALSNSANSLFALKQYQEALDTYNKAIAASPNYAEAFHNRGNLFRELKYYALAQKDYERGLLLKPEYDYLRGVHFATKMNLCDWSNFDEEWGEIARQIPVQQKVIAPFMVLPVSDSMALQRRVSEQWVAEKYISQVAPHFNIQETKGRKIRIGYFSADFHDHATMYLMAELFELHDKSKFETVGFSFGPDSQDGMRSRLIAALDQFYDVRTKTDEEVAKHARELGIDIAIDLKGFTLDSRTGIFAHRAAPIQINYLGYPGTMGAEFIDYIIADRVIIPESFKHLYSEQVLYMPDCYQINDRKRTISDKEFTREEQGLPTTGFVYCCFNANYKITPKIFDIWMRILEAVDGSVLWLFKDNEEAANNLREEARKRGVDPARLIFAQPMVLSEHLARHKLADLFLDTNPCNAHTTASDALWAGLPVLTNPGEAFASRVAASLLTVVGLSELIAANESEYEMLAIELARSADKLTTIKGKLFTELGNTPLFNSQKFVKNLENIYIELVEKDNLSQTMASA